VVALSRRKLLRKVVLEVPMLLKVVLEVVLRKLRVISMVLRMRMGIPLIPTLIFEILIGPGALPVTPIVMPLNPLIASPLNLPFDITLVCCC
jgi:hypothetical protein